MCTPLGVHEPPKAAMERPTPVAYAKRQEVLPYNYGCMRSIMLALWRKHSTTDTFGHSFVAFGCSCAPDANQIGQTAWLKRSHVSFMGCKGYGVVVMQSMCISQTGLQKTLGR